MSLCSAFSLTLHNSHKAVSFLSLCAMELFRLFWSCIANNIDTGRVYTYELDWNFHLNNTKYLDQACLARTQLFLSSPDESLYNYRDFKSYTIIYKNELRVGEKYRIKTEVSEFNQQFMYLLD
eukprot:sb/3475882/